MRPADAPVHDIPRRVATRVARICADAQTGGKRLAPDAMALLAAIPWADDLAELRDVLAQLVAGITRDEIQVDDVLAHVRIEPAPAPSGTLRSARRQFEREYISLVLRHHRGSVGDAARALGILRTNLYRKARQLGISVARPSAEPGTRHSAPGTRHPASGTRHPASGIRHPAPGTRDSASGTRHHAPRTSCPPPASGSRHSAPGVRHSAPGTRSLT